MRVTTDDGVGLEAVAMGRGPGLVLVHGFGGAKEDFGDHLAALSARHRVVAFDHRGHGRSDKPDRAEAYSLDRLAADVLAVADAAGLQAFGLLGHSMGGMVARRVVLAAPRRVRSLVLMDTSPGPPPGIEPARTDAAARVGLQLGKATLRALLDANDPLRTPAHERLLAERPGYQAYADAKWEALSMVMWAALASEIARQPDQLHRLATVRCPTLIVVGEEDTMFLEPSRQMAATIPGARLAVIPDAGHSPQFENPRAWFDAVDGFLGSVDGAAAPVRGGRAAT